MNSRRGKRRTDVTQEIDIQIGHNIRLRRIALKMSQKELADRLELTFQQVQKYEKGLNRIALSRAFQISKVLDCRVSDFMEGVEENGNSNAAFTHEAARAMQIFDQLSEPSKRATVAVMKALYAAQRGDDEVESPQPT